MWFAESGVNLRPVKIHIDYFRNPFSTFSYGSEQDATNMTNIQD